MRDQHDHSHRPPPLDKLVTELLECGGVLSQIIAGMVRFDAAGLSAPDLAPIPEVAHELILSVLDEVRRTYSKRDIRTAAAMIGLATNAIRDNIFGVDPSWIKAVQDGKEPFGPAPGGWLGAEPGCWFGGPASLN